MLHPVLEHYLMSHIAKGHSEFKFSACQKDGEVKFMIHSAQGDSISADFTVKGDTVTMGGLDDAGISWVKDLRKPEYLCLECGRKQFAALLFCDTCRKAEPHCSGCGEHVYKDGHSRHYKKMSWCGTCIKAGKDKEWQEAQDILKQGTGT